MELRRKEFSKNSKNLKRRRCQGYDCIFITKERLKHLVSKEALNIDGLGKRVIEQFWDLKIIKEPSSIYKLNYNKIKNLEGGRSFN